MAWVAPEKDAELVKAVKGAAEKAMERLADGLRLDVPEGDVEGR